MCIVKRCFIAVLLFLTALKRNQTRVCKLVVCLLVSMYLSGWYDAFLNESWKSLKNKDNANRNVGNTNTLRALLLVATL